MDSCGKEQQKVNIDDTSCMANKEEDDSEPNKFTIDTSNNGLKNSQTRTIPTGLF